MSRQKLNQAGVVSLTVSVVIMIVLSLIVISFARIMRRDQEQALDRQLNSQAYLSAESAINDARDALVAGTLENKDECTVPGDTEPLSAASIDDELLAEYTCVTVDDEPTSLEFDGVGEDRSTVFELKAVNSTNGDPANLRSVTFGWEASSGSNSNFVASNTDLPTAAGWASDPGALRIQMTPLPGAGFTRDALTTETMTFYVVPTTASPTNIGWGGLQDLSVAGLSGGGRIHSAACGTPDLGAGRPVTTKVCNVRVGNLPLRTDGNVGSYIVRITSLYRTNDIEIIADIAGGGNPPASFTGVQAVVDATGKANDVLRRIEERLPLRRYYDYPEYAVDIGSDLCKVLQATPDSAGGVNTTTVDPVGASSASCEL